MLVQEHGEALRLVRQQDHAQISGKLAHAWRGRPGRGEGGVSGAGGSVAPGEGDGRRADAGEGRGAGGRRPRRRLPYRLVWATGVHDAAWSELDRTPLLDAESGRPYSFHLLPLERKLGPYRRGIRRIAELDAYAGFQVSRHYCSFLDASDAPEFLERERRRRERLRPRLPPGVRGDDGLLDRELAYLKLFDTLSLYICLAAPGHKGGERPRWLVPDDRLEAPDGTEIRLRWRSPEALVLDPGAFGAGVEVSVPYREVPRRSEDQATLTRRWREAQVRHRVVGLEGPEA